MVSQQTEARYRAEIARIGLEEAIRLSELPSNQWREVKQQLNIRSNKKDSVLAQQRILKTIVQEIYQENPRIEIQAILEAQYGAAAIEELRNRILEEAQREADEIREEAQREADEIREEAQREADNIREAAQREADNIREAAQREADNIREAAQREADEIREETQQEADNIREESDDDLGLEDEDIEENQNLNLQQEIQKKLSEAEDEPLESISESDLIDLAEMNVIHEHKNLHDSQGQVIDIDKFTGSSPDKVIEEFRDYLENENINLDSKIGIKLTFKDETEDREFTAYQDFNTTGMTLDEIILSLEDIIDQAEGKYAKGISGVSVYSHN